MEGKQRLVWLITGASRGFGLEIVRAALQRGDAVAAAAREPGAVVRAVGERDRLLPIALDVTDAAQARAAVEQAVARFGAQHSREGEDRP